MSPLTGQKIQSSRFYPDYFKNWQFGSTMLIFLSALQGVSKTVYEAAEMDGASKIRQLFNITVPIITPVILFNAVKCISQSVSRV